jgi:hypothetical protein
MWPTSQLLEVTIPGYNYRIQRHRSFDNGRIRGAARVEITNVLNLAATASKHSRDRFWDIFIEMEQQAMRCR